MKKLLLSSLLISTYFLITSAQTGPSTTCNPAYTNASGNPIDDLPINSVFTQEVVIEGTSQLVTGMEVVIYFTHSYPGDMYFSLLHDETATTVDLYGNGLPGSCSEESFLDLKFSDLGTESAQTACSDGETEMGTFMASGTLANFDGENFDGAWTLTVADNAPGLDGGELFKWCLVQTVGGGSSNESPISQNDNTVLEENTTDTIAILENDTDSDGTIDTSSVTIVIDASSGTTESLTSGLLVYRPNADFFVFDTVTYAVCDDMAACDTAMVFIEVTEEIVSSIGDKSSFKNLLIYPNPTSNELNVNWKNNEIKNYSVINAVGKRILFNADVTGSVVKVNTSLLAKGMYFLQVIGDDKVATRSFQVE
jgi:hypothetical protein